MLNAEPRRADRRAIVKGLSAAAAVAVPAALTLHGDIGAAAKQARLRRWIARSRVRGPRHERG